jgi:hypothetical protein
MTREGEIDMKSSAPGDSRAAGDFLYLLYDSPRTRQAVRTMKTMIMIVFTGRKLIVFEILPNGSKFNQPYLVD